MPERYDEIDLSKIRTIGIGERGSTVSLDQFGDPHKGGKLFARWFDSLPDQLAARDLKRLVTDMRRTLSRKTYEIIWMIGAHVVKCGLSRYLIELMKKRYVTLIAMNGAGLIHDLEIALFGETSEDVPRNLERGVFGFSAETATHCFRAVSAGAEHDMGLGGSVGRYLHEERAPNRSSSILAEAYRLGVPVTVHIAIGTEILIQHPGYDGAVWGSLSARDFRVFAERVNGLGNAGGVVLNVGSAVILPEVFLKAYSVARNLGAPFDRITTCDLDMIRHYRPRENVLNRPARLGATSISLTGHHEIMIPLIYSLLLS
ncbi:MAG TPA: hypothetical protein VMX58_05385 [Patescibacteria group bacterium]|nr:hypothetical protein [Patescibacteria group bacterium]